MGSEPRDLGELTAAARSGERRQVLTVLLSELCVAFDAASPGVKPQMAAQIRATTAELDAIAGPKKVTNADEFARRREARLAAAVPPPSAAGEGQ